MNFLQLKDSVLGKIYIKKKDVYFKYSTSEQWTGEYWIDGKKIYTKVVAIPGFNADKNIAHGISNFGKALSIDLFMYSGTVSYMIPRAHRDNQYDGIGVHIGTNYLTLVVGQGNNFTSMTGYAIIKYTKTS